MTYKAALVPAQGFHRVSCAIVCLPGLASLSLGPSWEAWPEGHRLVPGFPPLSYPGQGRASSQPKTGPGWSQGKGVCALIQDSHGVSVKQGKLWGQGTRPGREAIRCAERGGSEKCCRPGLTRAHTLPSQKGAPYFLCHSHLILLGSTGQEGGE